MSWFKKEKPDGKDYIATRGSFTSEQAMWATKWWRENMQQQELSQDGFTHLKTKHPGILFSMLDDKDYSQAIYKMIRPKGQSQFKIDIDL